MNAMKPADLVRVAAPIAVFAIAAAAQSPGTAITPVIHAGD